MKFVANGYRTCVRSSYKHSLRGKAPTGTCFNNNILLFATFSTDSRTPLMIGNIRSTIPFLGQGVEVGQYAELERCYTSEDIEKYGDLVDDKNLVHSNTSWEDALDKYPHLNALKKAGIVRLQEEKPTQIVPLAHGMLVSSMFTSVFGTIAPGCVYMNQSLNFVAPVFMGEPVMARMVIDKVRKMKKGGVVVQCDTQVIMNYDNEEDAKPVITGSANVWIPSGYVLENIPTDTLNNGNEAEPVAPHF
eukprot:Nitzschia sp. Nitz4//scaffold41_size133979//54330//55193//NITZ4_003345-RA/size133979-snap-gene-0.101-mRNA-1//1//CDS//3329551464//805//frame0